MSSFEKNWITFWKILGKAYLERFTHKASHKFLWHGNIRLKLTGWKTDLDKPTAHPSERKITLHLMYDVFFIVWHWKYYNSISNTPYYRIACFDKGTGLIDGRYDPLLLNKHFLQHAHLPNATKLRRDIPCITASSSISIKLWFIQLLGY